MGLQSGHGAETTRRPAWLKDTVGADATTKETRMRSHNARSSPARSRLAERLFIGVCTATYVILLIAVVAALRAYGV